MTEPENPTTEPSAEETPSRPTIQMRGNPAVDAPPPSEEPVASSEESTASTASDESDDIWATPSLEDLPAPSEDDEEAGVAVQSDEGGSSDGSDMNADVDEGDHDDTGINIEALTPSIQPSPGDLASTAAAVRRWADDNAVDSDPYVTDLTDDISNRRRLTYWASLDPLEHLPTPQPKAGTRLRAAARFVLLLRNVGVFVPVALTWLAINRATEAFGDFTNDIEKSDIDTPVNFLQFWQSGVGDGTEYLESSWRIQHIAFLDALIIAVIILLTLVAGALDGQANARVAKRQQRADKERTAVALAIGKALHGNRSASPESIGEALALALTDLSEAARNVAAATARLEDSTSSFDSLKPRLESLSQQITNLNRHFATDVVNSVSSLSSSVGTLGTTLGGDMNRFLSEVLAGIEEINESFKKTSVTVEFGTKQLRDDLDAIHTRLSQVAGRR